MHSTKDATLQLIQKEISEVVQREKELKEIYSQLDTNKNKVSTNGISKPAITNGIGNSPKNGRIFTQNRYSKGAMHRFIKSRSTSNNNISPSCDNKIKSTSWTSPSVIELGKPIIPVGVPPRNGFVPIQERIRKEFLEMEERESELVMQRTKSQPDLLVILNSSSPEPSEHGNILQSARSITQLSDSSTYDTSFCSPPVSLKGARSLADLCDLEDEEIAPPGSINLIKRWEGIIQKNQHS